MHTQDNILLAEAVRKALAACITDADSITVDVECGTVNLRGVVASEMERKNAFDATRSVLGVQNVIDHLRVMTPTSFEQK